MTEPCPSCGAAQAAGASCRDCFDALLAFENEHPPAFGAVHHLTVPCYFLQHPEGYALRTLELWRDTLADCLDGRATPRELQARFGREFAGATRARDANAVRPPWWPVAWPMTVCRVLSPWEPPPSVEGYVERARTWAVATRAALNAAARGGQNPPNGANGAAGMKPPRERGTAR
jgi:hypothetical protein